MNDKILIKSGALGEKQTMSNLTKNELGYVTDKEELYIGSGTGNIRLCGKEDALKIAMLEGNLQAQYYTKAEIDALIAGINARIDAITPKE